MGMIPDAAFSVRERMWWDSKDEHTKDRNPQSIDEMLEWSGADWEPVKVPLFQVTQSVTCASSEGCTKLAVATVNEQHAACATHANVARKKGLSVKALQLKQLPGYYAVQRSDNDAVLNVASESYGLYLNRQTAELAEALIDPDKGANGFKVQFETGGTLDGGRKVWFAAFIDEPLEVPGDVSAYYPYVSLLNSHDGSAALTAINSAMRIKCWNTWNGALNEAGKTGRKFSFRHTNSIHDRVEEARKILMGAYDEAHEWVEYATKMVAIPFTDQQFESLLVDFVPMPPVVTDRVAVNVEEARASIKSFYHSSSCASIAGTAWGAIQAAGEYLDHGRTYRTKDSYVTRTMLRPEPGKLKAIKLVEELVGTNK